MIDFKTKQDFHDFIMSYYKSGVLDTLLTLETSITEYGIEEDKNLFTLSEIIHMINRMTVVAQKTGIHKSWEVE